MFRDAYGYPRVVARCASSQFLRWGGHDLNYDSRRTNIAFPFSVRCIEYPNETSRSKIFTCRIFETRDNNGARLLVMDWKKSYPVEAQTEGDDAVCVLPKIPLFIKYK